MSEYDRFPTSLWIFVADTFGFPVMMLSSDNVCGGDSSGFFFGHGSDRLCGVFRSLRRKSNMSLPPFLAISIIIAIVIVNVLAVVLVIVIVNDHC